LIFLRPVEKAVDVRQIYKGNVVKGSIRINIIQADSWILGGVVKKLGD
jgi:hypothetical protein